MEDSFKVRVDRLFGSLSSSSATAPQSSASPFSSLWCLTDDEVERKEWNRDKGSPEPEFDLGPRGGGLELGRKRRDFREELERDLEDLDDDLAEQEEEEEEEEEPRSRGSSSQSDKPDDYNDEEWEIKSSIGRDCTLDFEEEEDRYDKLAVGREKAGDRLYMKDVTNYGICIDHDNELPTSFSDAARDPRADHMAAKIRLKEDAEAAEKIDSLHVSEENAHLVANSQVHTAEVDVNLKSILKRKDGQSDSKTQKRVRFDPESIEEASAEAEPVTMDPSRTESSVSEDAEIAPSQDFSSAVPDYVRNPSRYTHYTFDSSTDMDEKSNRQAYMDFMNMLRKSKSTEICLDDSPVDIPKSVTFIPRKRGSMATMLDNGEELKQDNEDASKEAIRRRVTPVIAAVDAEDSELCAMEEDEVEEAVDKKQSLVRSGRQYRTKARTEDDLS
ncbi:histone acetyltransferase KAT6B [Rhodamnia argentea]|uniref:U5 small nuclear ribonucleoprotein TSSC4 n=1 Tax=Rhodamnia argentea TaxID=178133 RepID=A0A8B8NN98_9MYRT|nr:histone acetyltransferase KAT6B [Rhodamnia argentea]